MNNKSIQNLIVSTILDDLLKIINEDPAKYVPNYRKEIDGEIYLRQKGIEAAFRRIREDWME